MRIPAWDGQIPQALPQERVPGQEEGEEVETGQPGIEGEAVPGHEGCDTSKYDQGQAVAAPGGRHRGIWRTWVRRTRADGSGRGHVLMASTTLCAQKRRRPGVASTVRSTTAAGPSSRRGTNSGMSPRRSVRTMSAPASRRPAT